MQTLVGCQVTEKLYEGAATVVYRAQRDSDGRPVILKALKAERPALAELARLRHEYEIASQLDLEGVLKPLALERHRHGWVLVLEDFGGMTLEALIRKRRPDVSGALELALQLVTTLGVLHQRRVIHKDIKPSNVLVHPDTRQVKLTDFGISSRLTHEQSQVARALEGSLPYMSPEQTGRMNHPLDHRTDFYSLGVTLYELLTGTLPFTASDPLEYIHAHLARQARPVNLVDPAIPEPLSQVVQKLMAKAPEQRYLSARGVEADLTHCLGQLRATGTVQPFVLGRADVSGRFLMPQKVYAREQELRVLMAAFERASEAGPELLLLTGGSGVGKSALVGELRLPVIQRRGSFVSGKFDQLKHHVPYGALVQACHGLVAQVLTESAERLAAWKERLLAALGPNGRLITELLPGLELIIGPQAPRPPAPPAEAQHRFNLAWENFIGIFATEEHPLVLFLDDLQWVDQATLHLLQHLLTAARTRHFLVVSAFRDNEVDAAHPLRLGLERMRERGARVEELALAPLEANALAELLVDTLQVSRDRAEPLAALLHARTGGNPFFALQLLKALRDRQLLVPVQLSAQGAALEGAVHFEWDLARIQQMELPESAVEFVAGRLRELPAAARKALEMASCLGNTFKLSTLALVEERPASEVIRGLRAAIDVELLLGAADLDFTTYAMAESEAPADLVLRFPHDRVQQAAQALMDAAQRQALHRQIGRVLRQHSVDGSEALEERLFDIVGHLTLGLELLTAQEREDLYQLAHTAARKARTSQAYEAALAYLKTALALAPPEPWEACYAQTFAQHLLKSECEYQTGGWNTAEQGCTVLAQKARSDEDRLQVYNLRIAIYTSRGRYQEALQLSIEAAPLLGASLSASPGKLDIGLAVLRAKWLLSGKKPADLLALKEMTDPRQIAIMDFFMDMASSAFLSTPDLAVLLALRMFHISMRHGVSKVTPFGFMIYAVVCSGMGQHRQAQQMGELALQLNQRVGNALREPILNFLFAGTINPWNRHVQTNTPYLTRAYERAREVGDINFADYSLLTLMMNSSFKGDPVEQAMARCEQYLEFVVRMKGSDLGATLQGQTGLVQRQSLRSLQGRTRATGSLDDEDFREAEHVSRLEADLELFFFYVYKLHVACVFRRHDEALDAARRVGRVVGAARVLGDVRVSDHDFYSGLVLAALYPSAGPRERKQYRKQLARHCKALAQLAGNCPENFGHKHLLVRAELAALSAQPQQALKLYDQAIQGAMEQEYLHVEALANECAGRFCLRTGQEPRAHAYLCEARYAYLRWGATAKVGELDREFPQLERRTQPRPAMALSGTVTTPTPGAGLDLDTIMKAARAISGEIELERLTRTLMRIMLESAGAERGLLLLEDKGQLLLQAESLLEPDGSVTTTLRNVPLEQTERVPAAIIHYTVRVRESVVLSNAAEEGLFIKDPYVTRFSPRSVLCMPLAAQGRVISVLYLENNLTAGAFTSDRLEVLRLLVAQAALSISNAMLYDSLKDTNERLEDYSHTLAQRVEERTRELSTKNTELSAALQSLRETQRQLVVQEKLASLGALTAGIAHELKNPLNFINNFGEISVSRAQEIEELMKEQLQRLEPALIEDLEGAVKELRQSVSKIQEHGKRASRIIDGMLLHSRPTRGLRERVALNTLVAESVTFACHAARAKNPGLRLELQSEYDKSITDMELVRDALQRVLLNIMDNACYALHQKAQAQGPGFVPVLGVWTRNLGERVEVRIRDNGTGIAPELADKLFTPFFTSKPPGEGTGLGLSISREIIVDAHQGELRFESKPGEFTEFIILLPKKAPALLQQAS